MVRWYLVPTQLPATVPGYAYLATVATSYSYQATYHLLLPLLQGRAPSNGETFYFEPPRRPRPAPLLHHRAWPKSRMRAVVLDGSGGCLFTWDLDEHAEVMYVCMYVGMYVCMYVCMYV